jgi:uncharacterized protein (TIGR00369 family)
MPTSTPTLEELARTAEFFNHSTPMSHAGFRLSFPSTDMVVADLPLVQPQHRGGLGTAAVNGGVLAALFDLVTGCTPLLLDVRRRTATVQLSMSFERPVFGDSVRAEARIDSFGRRTLFASARILDAKGQPCAHCQAVVAVARAEAAAVKPEGA